MTSYRQTADKPKCQILAEIRNFCEKAKSTERVSTELKGSYIDLLPRPEGINLIRSGAPNKAGFVQCILTFIIVPIKTSIREQRQDMPDWFTTSRCHNYYFLFKSDAEAGIICRDRFVERGTAGRDLNSTQDLALRSW